MTMLSLPWVPNTDRIISSALIGSQGWHNLTPSPPYQLHFSLPKHHSSFVIHTVPVHHSPCVIHSPWTPQSLGYNPPDSHSPYRTLILFPVQFLYVSLPLPGIHFSPFLCTQESLAMSPLYDTSLTHLSKLRILSKIPRSAFKHKEINLTELDVFWL